MPEHSCKHALCLHPLHSIPCQPGGVPPAGLLPKWGAIPRWWKWYGYINPLRYGYGAVAINAFEGHPGAELGGLPVRCVAALLGWRLPVPDCRDAGSDAGPELVL